MLFKYIYEKIIYFFEKKEEYDCEAPQLIPDIPLREIIIHKMFFQKKKISFRIINLLLP